jgi:hypothetical protein
LHVFALFYFAADLIRGEARKLHAAFHYGFPKQFLFCPKRTQGEEQLQGAVFAMYLQDLLAA